MPNKLTADRSQLEDDERKLVEDVENVGWHVIGIEEDEEGPGFAYTIGLHHSFEHPEVIVFGLRTETLFQIVDTIGEAVRDGTKLSRITRAAMFSTIISFTFGQSTSNTTRNTLDMPGGSMMATASRHSSASGLIPRAAIHGIQKSMPRWQSGSQS